MFFFYDGVYLLSALICYHGQFHPLVRAAGGKAHASIRPLRFLGFRIEVVRGFQVAVYFRKKSNVVKSKSVLWIESVSALKVSTSIRQIVSIRSGDALQT